MRRAREGPRSPHDPRPEPLRAILKRTTKAPLFCHPKLWSEVHLSVLRVTGFGETRTLGEIFGRPMVCSPLDIHLKKATEEISPPFRLGQFNNDVELMLQMYDAKPTNADMEKCIQGMCVNWLKAVRAEVRRYPFIQPG